MRFFRVNVSRDQVFPIGKEYQVGCAKPFHKSIRKGINWGQHGKQQYQFTHGG